MQATFVHGITVLLCLQLFPGPFHPGSGGSQNQKSRIHEKCPKIDLRTAKSRKNAPGNREKPEKQGKNQNEGENNILQQDKVCIPLFFILYSTSN